MDKKHSLQMTEISDVDELRSGLLQQNKSTIFNINESVKLLNSPKTNDKSQIFSK